MKFNNAIKKIIYPHYLCHIEREMLISYFPYD